MKKLSFIVTAVLVSLLFITASVSAQDVVDLVKEGKQLMEASQYLIDQGQMMEKCACTDKAAMITKGNEMVKKGEDVIASGMMMMTADGRSGNREVGEKIRSAGNLLIKKGKQAGPLTDKDKEEVNKLGKEMASLGNLEAEYGQNNVRRIIGIEKQLSISRRGCKTPPAFFMWSPACLQVFVIPRGILQSFIILNGGIIAKLFGFQVLVPTLIIFITSSTTTSLFIFDLPCPLRCTCGLVLPVEVVVVDVPVCAIVVSRRSLNVTGKDVVFEYRVVQFHVHVAEIFLIENRQDGIGSVGGKAVFFLYPLRHGLCGCVWEQCRTPISICCYEQYNFFHGIFLLCIRGC